MRARADDPIWLIASAKVIERYNLIREFKKEHRFINCEHSGHRIACDPKIVPRLSRCQIFDMAIMELMGKKDLA